MKQDPSQSTTRSRDSLRLKAITEQRNPRSTGLDKKAIPELVQLFIAEEQYVNLALKKAKAEIIRACTLISQVLDNDGHLFYLGAGTSGRLGVLDASEMPPTFNVPTNLIQGLIAGGPPALTRSQEGAEDDMQTAGKELKARKLTSRDIVVGISANGHAPYVLGGLIYAKSKKARTILLTCNPRRLPFPEADIGIDLKTGPELITGSTRLKAGTATKLVLNMFSSIAMIRSGRVLDNLMINVQPTNAKLKQRALCLVMTLRDVTSDEAKVLLMKAKWNVPKALKLQ